MKQFKRADATTDGIVMQFPDKFKNRFLKFPRPERVGAAPALSA
jgi:hypothetical protein